MNLISVKDLRHSEGGKLLFENITFGIDDIDKIAIVGINGSGKSTLLQLLSGGKTAESGSVVHNNKLKCAFLEQNPEFSGSDSIADFVLSGESAEMSLIREYETILAEMQSGADKDGEKLPAVMAEMDRLDCWSIETRIHSIMSELGIDDLSRKMSELSGGMIKKAAIARTLVLDSNMIILDEPTNHLDIETINWLEKYLRASTKAVLLVTHDRYFMDSVCGSIIEIEDNTVYSYEGNYSLFVEQKSRREDIRERAAERVSNILRNEAKWLMRGPRARAGKDKKRKQKYFDLKNSRPEKKIESEGFSVEGRRLGGKILELENVGKSFDGRAVVRDFSFGFRKGDKIGILGANGSGKTTLLNLMSGRLAPEEGCVDTGVNTRFGYYDQLSRELPGNVRAVDYINETAEVVTMKDGSRMSPAQFLERFLFSKNLLYTEIANLSGGEKKKLYLLKILLENPNFLLFDEPTNDFDIQTLSILEDFLENFAGCAVIVSHDRFFLDRTTDFLFVIDGSGGVSGYSGDVSSYYENAAASAGDEGSGNSDRNGSGKAKKSGGKSVSRQKKGLSFKEKQEFESIEEEIMLLEAEKEDLDLFFTSPAAAAADLSLKKQRYDAVVLEIEQKYARWEYLESNNK